LPAPYYQHNYLGEFATPATALANVVLRGWDVAGVAQPGQFYYDTTYNAFRVWDGTEWAGSGVLRVAALPGASSVFAGTLVIVIGGGGVRDTLHVCLKSAAGAYAWTQLAEGGE